MSKNNPRERGAKPQGSHRRGDAPLALFKVRLRRTETVISETEIAIWAQNTDEAEEQALSEVTKSDWTADYSETTDLETDSVEFVKAQDGWTHLDEGTLADGWYFNSRRDEPCIWAEEGGPIPGTDVLVGFRVDYADWADHSWAIWLACPVLLLERMVPASSAEQSHCVREETPYDMEAFLRIVRQPAREFVNSLAPRIQALQDRAVPKEGSS